jgi:hypothetical protein
LLLMQYFHAHQVMMILTDMGYLRLEFPSFFFLHFLMLFSFPFSSFFFLHPSSPSSSLLFSIIRYFGFLLMQYFHAHCIMMILQHRFVPVKAREGRLAVDLKGIREAWVVQVVAQCCDEHVEFFLRIRKYYVSMSGRGKKEGEGEGNDLKGIREARMVQVVAQCCDEHVEFFL